MPEDQIKDEIKKLEDVIYQDCFENFYYLVYVIHTVGPVWNGGQKNEENLLANCYFNSLRLAVDNSCTTIAFPNISTGIYRFPKKLAAQISINARNQFLESNTTIKLITIVCFDDENFQLFNDYLGDRPMLLPSK